VKKSEHPDRGKTGTRIKRLERGLSTEGESEQRTAAQIRRPVKEMSARAKSSQQYKRGERRKRTWGRKRENHVALDLREKKGDSEEKWMLER